MQSVSVIILTFLLLSSISDISDAAVYRYIDKYGKVSFTNIAVSTKYKYYKAEATDSAEQPHSVSDLIEHYAKLYTIDKHLIRAVIRTESNFVKNAVSSTGAKGLMQLAPETVKDLNINDPFNPRENIAGGSKYLRKMLNRFDGNLDLSLAAYNAGPSTVERYNAIPPYQETRNYVKKVKYYLKLYRQGGT